MYGGLIPVKLNALYKILKQNYMQNLCIETSGLQDMNILQYKTFTKSEKFLNYKKKIDDFFHMIIHNFQYRWAAALYRSVL